jgi:hypothetical protein
MSDHGFLNQDEMEAVRADRQDNRKSMKAWKAKARAMIAGLEAKIKVIDDGLASAMEDLGIERQLRQEAESRLREAEKERDTAITNASDQYQDMKARAESLSRELAEAKQWRVEAEKQGKDCLGALMKRTFELHAAESANAALRKALAFYARRTDDEGWQNWTQAVCDSMSGLVAHFDWPGDEADEPWEVAEKALSSPPAPESGKPIPYSGPLLGKCASGECGHDDGSWCERGPDVCAPDSGRAEG